MSGHEELRQPDTAAARIVHDTLVHLVRTRDARPELVRVAIPEGWDESSFAARMTDGYAARGWPDVRVVVLRTAGEARLLSVVTG